LVASHLQPGLAGAGTRRNALPVPWVANVARDPQGRSLDLIGAEESTPVVSRADGERAVVFDGVLYNRAELAVELGARGTSPNDADLLLLAYDRWGQDLPHHIKGIFALVLVDPRNRLCLAVRDALGSYPLFFTEAGDRLLLSTSIDALREQPGVDRSLNKAALADHLCRRWLNVHETFFTAIRRVPPGYMLQSSRGRTTVTRYWDPVPLGKPVDWVKEDELQEQFDTRFERAVEHAFNQGPSGIFLSGGLDSISVAAMASDVARRDDKPLPLALSLAFPGDTNEELEQRGVATSLGLAQEMLPFAEAVPKEQLLTSALSITRMRPAPILNTWMAAYAELTLRGKRRGVEVVLSGAGGDEWLAVTPSLAADLIRTGDLKGLRHLIRSWKRSYNMSVPGVLHCLLWTFGLRPLASAGLAKLAPGAWEANRISRSVRNRLAWVAPEADLQKELEARVRQWTPSPIPTRGFYLGDVRASIEHPLTSMELEEIFEMGRWLGVRYLHPYWDADVANILYRTPPLLLFGGGRAKSAVRQTMARRFPSLGLDRQKKRAGTAYFCTVLDREIPDLWRRNGDLSAMADMGIVEPRSAAAMATRSIESNVGIGLVRIWDLMNVENWIRAHQ
jgi:asparagine synthetase B (glutamine-hydrolysing)